MKVELATGTEYQGSNAEVTEDGQLCITLTGLTEPLNETIVRKSFTFAAMSAVKCYQDDTEYQVYEGYTLLDYYNVKIKDNSFDMVLYFSKYADSKRVDDLEKNVSLIFDSVYYILAELIPGIRLGI